MFCCSGVAIYNYLKMQDIRLPVKGNPSQGLVSPRMRSKESVLLEMRKLQDELNTIDEMLHSEPQGGHQDGSSDRKDKV